MSDHNANIQGLKELHAQVYPEVEVTLSQLASEFPIFVRALAHTIEEVQSLGVQVKLLGDLANFKFIELLKEIEDLKAKVKELTS